MRCLNSLKWQSSPRPSTQGAWVEGRGYDWHFRLMFERSKCVEHINRKMLITIMTTITRIIMIITRKATQSMRAVTHALQFKYTKLGSFFC